MQNYKSYKTGHGCYKQRLKKIKMIEDDLCDCHMSIQTLDHILWDCPHYDRSLLMNWMNKEGFTQPYNIETVMKSGSLECIDAIPQFFKMNNIII